MAKSVVDGTWTCPQCGAWNAPWLKRCFGCGTINDKFDEETYSDFSSL